MLRGEALLLHGQHLAAVLHPVGGRLHGDLVVAGPVHPAALPHLHGLLGPHLNLLSVHLQLVA